MPISNHNKGAILFAIIYINVFLLSGLVEFGRPALIKSNPLVANAVIATPTAAQSSSTVEILVIEIIIISAIVLAEMRYKFLSKLYIILMRLKKHWLIMDTILAFMLIGSGYYLLKTSGMALFLFWTINFLGIYIVYAILLRKLKLRALMPIFITFISLLILWPFILLLVGKTLILLLFMEFAYFPLAFLISALIMRNPTKNKLNAIAFSFSVLLPPTIGMLFVPIYAVGLLAIFAIYDFIAVFFTKHMQFMAQKLLALNAPEAFMIGDFEMIKKRIASLGKNAVEDDTALKDIDKPLIFGVGDAVLPGIVISSFVSAGGWLIALFAAFGAIVGVVANLQVLKVKKRVLPALPLIFCFMVIAIFVGLII
ncbi:MAG: presenilin family intramembrane aspartyl protease [Candidatus Micrarchaeaceae archaeon]